MKVNHIEMSKMSVFLFYVSLHFFCASGIEQRGIRESQVINLKDEERYTVLRIDSLDKIYLIYAQKKNYRYKIISRKEDSEKCSKQIEVNAQYNFDLKDARHVIIKDSGGVKYSHYLHNVNCLSIDNRTKVCINDSLNYIQSLFYATNIKGLCYLGDSANLGFEYPF